MVIIVLFLSVSIFSEVYVFHFKRHTYIDTSLYRYVYLSIYLSSRSLNTCTELYLFITFDTWILLLVT